MSNHDSSDLDERVTELESLVESQQATIESLRQDLEAAKTVGTGAVSRRSALQTGGVLGLLGLGATSATAGGQIGTENRPVGTVLADEVGAPGAPLESIHTDELAGGIVDGDESITTLSGNITVTESEPGSSGTGDLWVDPSGGQIGVWNGTEWVAVGGSAPSQFTDVPNSTALQAHYSSTHISLTPGESVLSWCDLSGNDNDLRAPSTDSAPVLEQVDGTRTVRFSGDAWLEASPISFETIPEGHFFIVLERDSSPPSDGDEKNWQTDENNNNHYPFTNGQIYEGLGVSGRPIETVWPSVDIDTLHYYEVQVASEYKIGQNGSIIASTSGVTVNLSDFFRLGAGPIGNQTPMTGNIFEVLWYEGVQDDATRDDIDSYLRDRWPI